MINVAIAWFLAVRPYDCVADDEASLYGHFDLIVPLRGLGRRMYRSPGRCEVQEYHRRISLDLTPSPDLRGPEWYGRLPRASRLRDHSPVTELETRLGRRTNAIYQEHIAGWPASALIGYELTEAESSKALYGSGGRLALPAAWRDGARVAWVPCQPLWGGFALNSALYGVGLWIVIFGPICMRCQWQAKQRVLRGQCVTCGYDLRGTAHIACPECGAPQSAVV